MTPLSHKHTPRPIQTRRATRLIAGAAALTLIPLGIAFASTATAADPAIDLGTAKAFSVLAGSGVTNTGVTKLAGSLGTYATPTVTTDTPFVFTGAAATNHAGDGVTQQAKSDLLVAYNAVAGALPPTAIPQELTRNDPYLPGIYRASSSLLLSGAMTLDGGGRNDGVFIFQAPTSTLTTASNSTVKFVNGAQPCNVYWQVGSSATFGTGTSFVGNVLAHTSITANTNATFQGRLLANNGAVTLDSNTFTTPACDTSGGGTTTPPGGGTTTPPGGGTTTPPGGGTTTPPGGGTTTPPGGGTTTPPGSGTGDNSTGGTDNGGASALEVSTGSSNNQGDTGESSGLPNTGGLPALWLVAALGVIAAGLVALRGARITRRRR